MYHLHLQGRNPEGVGNIVLWNTEPTSLVKQYVKTQQDGKCTNNRFNPKLYGCTTSLEVKYAQSSHWNILQSK